LQVSNIYQFAMSSNIRGNTISFLAIDDNPVGYYYPLNEKMGHCKNENNSELEFIKKALVALDKAKRNVCNTVDWLNKASPADFTRKRERIIESLSTDTVCINCPHKFKKLAGECKMKISLDWDNNFTLVCELRNKE